MRESEEKCLENLMGNWNGKGNFGTLELTYQDDDDAGGKFL